MKKPKVFLDGNFTMIIGEDTGNQQYKAYRYKWNNWPKRFRVAKFPLHLDIELNTDCNLRCGSCFQSFNTPKKEVMPLEMFKKIIDEGARKGLCSIKLNYRGEPLLYPHLAEAIRYAKTRGIIDVMFNTNGLLLNLLMAHELIISKLDKIIFSVDDHRHLEYKKLRVGSSLSKVVNNMHNLKSLRNYLKSSTPIIRVQKIDRSPEFNDEYIKFFKPFADQIAFHELLDYKVKETSEPMPDWCCASLWQRMLILADGTIAPCCGLNADIFNLGNVKYDSIGLRWNYYVMNSIRAFHKEGMSHRVSICRKCPLRLHYL